MLVHRRVTASIKFASTHFYTWYTLSDLAPNKSKRVVRGGSRSGFLENKLVLSQLTGNEIIISHFTKNGIFCYDRTQLVIFEKLRVGVSFFIFIGRFQKISIPIPRTAFLKWKGVHDYGILRAWGGIYVLKSEGMGGFHRWDFWSRKCTVSSFKTLSLWTFIVRK